jgi:hypothetical protein
LPFFLAFHHFLVNIIYFLAFFEICVACFHWWPGSQSEMCTSGLVYFMLTQTLFFAAMHYKQWCRWIAMWEQSPRKLW